RRVAWQRLMGGDERESARPQMRVDQLAEQAQPVRVERGAGFVEQPEAPRVRARQPGERHAPPLPRRQAREREPRLAREADAVDGGVELGTRHAQPVERGIPDAVLALVHGVLPTRGLVPVETYP